MHQHGYIKKTCINCGVTRYEQISKSEEHSGGTEYKYVDEGYEHKHVIQTVCKTCSEVLEEEYEWHYGGYLASWGASQQKGWMVCVCDKTTALLWTVTQSRYENNLPTGSGASAAWLWCDIRGHKGTCLTGTCSCTSLNDVIEYRDYN